MSFKQIASSLLFLTIFVSSCSTFFKQGQFENPPRDLIPSKAFQDQKRLPAQVNYSSKEFGIPWAIDPTDYGPTQPPQGQSLFDDVFKEGENYVLPFPFEKIKNRLESLTSSGSGVSAVLIPIGRSLQKNDALGLGPLPADEAYFRYPTEYFKFPRVVVAVTDEPATPGAKTSEYNLQTNLRGRFYLGFSEASKTIEAVTYNELAGRFEFQEVKNYGEKGQNVVYVDRIRCMHCHQNQAPLFARGKGREWRETNGNKQVSDRIAKAQGCVARDCTKEKYSGVPIYQSDDIPEKIDFSTDDANLILVWQKYWREGCQGDREDRGKNYDSYGCRALFLGAMIAHRLGVPLEYKNLENYSPYAATKKDYQLTELAKSLDEGMLKVQKMNWSRLWPLGFRVPNPDLPSRDPFLELKRQCDPDPGYPNRNESYSADSNEISLFKLFSERQIALHPRCDAFVPRNARVDSDDPSKKSILGAYEEGFNNEVLHAIKEMSVFFTDTDIEVLKGHLSKGSKAGALNESQILSAIKKTVASVLDKARAEDGLHRRLLANNPLSRELAVKLLIEELGGRVNLKRDFSLREDVRLKKQEGVTLDEIEVPSDFPHLRPYFKYCYSCHHDEHTKGFIPNFMHVKPSDSTRRFEIISKKINRCAESIFTRLNLYADGGARRMPRDLHSDLEKEFRRDLPEMMTGLVWNLSQKYMARLQGEVPLGENFKGLPPREAYTRHLLDQFSQSGKIKIPFFEKYNQCLSEMEIFDSKSVVGE